VLLKILKLIVRYILYFRDVSWDAFYYFNYSTLKIKKRNNENLSAQILAHVHSVERAFSLKSPRKTFGIELVENLKKLIKNIKVKNKYNYELKIFQSAMTEYSNYHKIQNSYSSYLKPYKAYLHESSNLNSLYKDVVNSRHSIRSFGRHNISDLCVLKAISHAKNITPSVCNRQAWEVVLIRDKEHVRRVLEFQNGNTGIENIQNVVLVCSTMTSFFGSSERNQPYIDGGIFLMSLLNSFHYYNIANCALNWSVDRNKDSKLKKFLNIDNSRVIITMIGLGSYDVKEIKVASSYRKPLKDILRIVE